MRRRGALPPTGARLLAEERAYAPAQAASLPHGGGQNVEKRWVFDRARVLQDPLPAPTQVDVDAGPRDWSPAPQSTQMPGQKH